MYFMHIRTSNTVLTSNFNYILLFLIVQTSDHDNQYRLPGTRLPLKCQLAFDNFFISPTSLGLCLNNKLQGTLLLSTYQYTTQYKTSQAHSNADHLDYLFMYSVVSIHMHWNMSC